MSLGALVISVAFFQLYFSLKYTDFYDYFDERPTLRQVWSYKYENNTKRGRFSRSFKLLAVFFVFFSSIASFFNDPLTVILENTELRTFSIKILCLSCMGLNFMGRYVIYQDTLKLRVKDEIPGRVMIDVLRKTPWFVKGKDVLAVVVNSSTVLMIVILFCLILSCL